MNPQQNPMVTQPAPQPPHTNRIVVIIVSVIIGVIVLVGFAVIVGLAVGRGWQRTVAAGEVSCDQKNELLSSRKEALLSELLAYPLVSGQTDVASSAKFYDGDCFETSPRIDVFIKYSLPDQPIEQVLATADTSLSSAGYTRSSQWSSEATKSPCDKSYGFNVDTVDGTLHEKRMLTLDMTCAVSTNQVVTTLTLTGTFYTT